jgi:Fibronectin type III domain.
MKCCRTCRVRTIIIIFRLRYNLIDLIFDFVIIHIFTTDVFFYLFWEPGKPIDVRFVEVNYQYVEVEWKEPLQPNGRLSRYRVHYRLNDTGASWVEVAVNQFIPRTARVYGLVFNKYYEFKIEATNSIDWGEPAIEVVLVTSERCKFSVHMPVKSTFVFFVLFFTIFVKQVT